MQARADERTRRVEALVRRHHDLLVRTARYHSLCDADAEDAVQRALVIFITRLERVDRATELAWLKAVVRNEARAVRRTRAGTVSETEPDFDRSPSPGLAAPDERIHGIERVEHGAAVFAQLKPDERRALLARAGGLSYSEIATSFSWTRTKTNRALTEGRAAFMRLFRAVEEGEQCHAFEPAIATLAGGAARADEFPGLHEHLLACWRCRARARRMRASASQRSAAALVLPLGLAGRWLAGRVVHAKAAAYGWAGRIAELPAAAPLESGGGRTASVGALLGLCLAGAGAGGYCVLAPPASPGPKHSMARVVPARHVAHPSAASRPERSSAPSVIADDTGHAVRRQQRPTPLAVGHATAPRVATSREFSLQQRDPGRASAAGPGARGPDPRPRVRAATPRPGFGRSADFTIG